MFFIKSVWSELDWSGDYKYSLTDTLICLPWLSLEDSTTLFFTNNLTKDLIDILF